MEDPVVETVLHEEVVRTRTATVPVRRARLQRVVVRERRTIEVEVAHEELRVVYDDLDAGGTLPTDGSAEPVVLVLHEERVDLVRRVVPVERVTAHVEPVAGERRVDVAVAHEVAEVARDVGTPTDAA